MGGLYEVDKTSGGTVTQTRTYYPAGGAMRIGSTLYYTLKDHLGSASVVTDASGNTVGEDRFYPFGETRFTTGTMFTDKLFTGQRNTGLGIYHYGARFYSPKLGRFLSADTIVPSFANPQNLNRYSYVTNNPLRYTDPTGHKETECASQYDPACSAVNGGSTGNTTTTGGTMRKPHKKDDDGNKGGADPGGDILGGGKGNDTAFFTHPGYSVPEFIGGAILFVGGFGFAVFGVSLIAIAVGEVLGGVETGPGELLILPHAAGMVAIGGGLLVIGAVSIGLGYLAMKDALTP